MREDVEFNVKFVKLVEQYPALYDSSRSDSIRIVQEKIWEKISKQLNEPVQDCRDRWRNLRNRYCKCHNKKKTAEDVSKVKDYYLGPHMRFLDKFLHVRQRKRYIDPKEDPTEATEDDNDDEFDNQESNQSFDKNPEIPIVDPGTLFISKRSRSSTEDFDDTRTFDDGAKNPFLEEYFTTERKRKNPAKESVEAVDPLDSDYYFLKSLLPDMAEMTPAQKRRFKTRVMTLAAEILDGHETSSASMSYTHKKPKNL